MTPLEVRDPRTGECVGQVNELDAQAVDRAYAVAQHAQVKWAQVPVKERAAIMMRLHDLILRNHNELLDLIQQETGKNRRSAFDEILDVAVTARHYAKRAPYLLRRHAAQGALPMVTKTRVDHAPIGVVGIISPWNYPLTLTISDAIPALLAGNAVILKPDSQTPLTAIYAARLLVDAGLDPDLYQILPGPGRIVGDRIARVADYLMFTGSTQTGRSLGAIAGERLIGFSAELGGKNPLIISPDADLSRAVRGTIEAAFSNSGQLCISIERVYVHQDIADTFIPALVKKVKEMRIGGGGWEEDMGSLISAEHRTHVMEYLDDALSHGATLLHGGPRDDLGPAYLDPIVLTGVTDSARLYREEVFGPVIAIEVVADEETAIKKANDTQYGLNSAVFARSRTGWRIAGQLESGTVNINEGFAAAFGSVDAPMGGWKASGTGRRHADDGLLKYTEARTIAEQRFFPISGPQGVDRERYAGFLMNVLRWGKHIL
ncbi:MULTISPECIES: succinic semialdehyde dehydrogenase [unclassified Corynebacterium]|uniref:succinic semialdehyde dehydrogenase n=1 Tax=unclassified Corynebacterium TaxID=2624378 RepID=UPI0021672442|nr:MULTISPECIES: succinic semialdehyde dehydrogenase [unclassified Corynebacterium]MCS4491256.1 succinic semialdehyde dehydrogenase [Corynebacterium sp. ES2715-CONJ3]MCS4531647.1 succinic semialdehyde dehydrogenase [Corynebacterium sp. ES2730-CONJ]